MPIYEYYCDDCLTKFELLRPFTKADSETLCKKCRSSNTRRILSLFNSLSEGGKSVNNSSGACGNCSGGSCNSCHN